MYCQQNGDNDEYINIQKMCFRQSYYKPIGGLISYCGTIHCLVEQCVETILTRKIWQQKYWTFISKSLQKWLHILMIIWTLECISPVKLFHSLIRSLTTVNEWYKNNTSTMIYPSEEFHWIYRLTRHVLLIVCHLWRTKRQNVTKKWTSFIISSGFKQLSYW